MHRSTRHPNGLYAWVNATSIGGAVRTLFTAHGFESTQSAELAGVVPAHETAPTFWMAPARVP